MVVTTYSVIIMNKRTTDDFLKYQPLFIESINNGRIGVCKWIESGTTIDTAVPELSEMTNDKEEWRAVIVRFEDDRIMSGFEFDAQNPYDFKKNSLKKETIEESEIPLIRLTQMLGGVPPPEMKFECEQIFEKNKAPRTVYKPVSDASQQEAYQKLCQKYEFDGKLPSSIVLITVRSGFEEQTSVDKVWTPHRESNSSEFWKRNRYPSSCRFLVYDFYKQGPLQRTADELAFWTSILLISTNEIESSTVQGYRLYNIKLDFDKSKMQDSFQLVINRLYSAKTVIEKDIRKSIESQLTIQKDLPDYRIEVPVSVELPDDSEYTIKSKYFGLLSNGVNLDIAKWSEQTDSAKRRLSKAVKMADRSLDHTAEHMKAMCFLEEDEVSNLDKYQIEDLTEETQKIYRDIVGIQGKLPNRDELEDSRTELLSQKIQRYLLGRIEKKSAITAILISVLLIVLCNVPAFVHYFLYNVGSVENIAIVIIIEIFVIVVAALLTIIGQKIELNGLLRTYNSYINAAFNKITDNANTYSRYLSGIASHMRGHSYLNLANKKKFQAESNQRFKYKHLKAINVMLSKLNSWGIAYHLNVDFQKPAITENIIIDTGLNPTQNYMYTFEVGNSYFVPLNNSGEELISPFSFVEKIQILREELYDDDIS